MIELNENITREMNKYLEGIAIEDIFLILSAKKKTFHYPVFFTKEQMSQEIEVLDLSVRAYHCLKRAGYSTLGSLVNGIYTKDGETSKRQLKKIRNLGQNSADEIMINRIKSATHINAIVKAILSLFFISFTPLSAGSCYTNLLSTKLRSSILFM